MSDYLYDGNGNQIKRIKGKSKAAFRGRTALGIKTEEELKGEYEIREYGLFNQLREVRDGRDRVSYSYKPDGLRLSKTVNGVRTGFVWDNGNIIETTDGDGNPTGIYKYGLGRVSDNKRNYYIYNAHGDVTGLTDSAGNVVREYEYDAFGMEVSKDSSDTNPFRYCGEYYDNETESIYLRARNYDQGMGRFTSEDTARDGLNWYAYCGNNPVMFKDPSGRTRETDGKYTVAIQKQLLEYSRKYNIAKRIGDKELMNTLSKLADMLRKEKNEYSLMKDGVEPSLANKISNHQNPYVGIKTRFMFGIMRMMQNKGWDPFS